MLDNNYVIFSIPLHAEAKTYCTLSPKPLTPQNPKPIGLLHAELGVLPALSSQQAPGRFLRGNQGRFRV